MKIRTTTQISYTGNFASATLDWSLHHETSSFLAYIIKHGIYHLLFINRVRDAEDLLLDYSFMAKLLSSYETFIEPALFWRCIGLKRLTKGYLDVLRELIDYGDVDIHSLNDLMSIAYFLTEMGLYFPAEKIAEHIVCIREKVFGFEHEQTLYAVNLLAHIYSELGHYEKAEPLYLRSLNGIQKKETSEHEDSLTAMVNLASLYHTMGRYKESMTLQLQALKIREKKFGPDHEATLNSIGHLSVLYKDIGQYEKAESLYLRLLHSRKRILGSSHPSTLRASGNLALFFKSQERSQR